MNDERQTIFVFGSNTEGRHGKGAALEALRHWGAKYGQARGPQGRSYAIVTKELRTWMPRVTLNSILMEVLAFKNWAIGHPEFTFQVTPIGCGLAGFTPGQIGPMFRGSPENVVLPKVFVPYQEIPT